MLRKGRSREGRGYFPAVEFGKYLKPHSLSPPHSNIQRGILSEFLEGVGVGGLSLIWKIQLLQFSTKRINFCFSYLSTLYFLHSLPLQLFLLLPLPLLFLSEHFLLPLHFLLSPHLLLLSSSLFFLSPHFLFLFPPHFLFLSASFFFLPSFCFFLFTLNEKGKYGHMTRFFWGRGLKFGFG